MSDRTKDFFLYPKPVTKKFNGCRFTITQVCDKETHHVSTSLVTNFKFKKDEDEYDIAVDGLEAFMLALVAQGFDITDKSIIEAIENTLETLANHFL